MNILINEKIKHIHFVGIGGISMSGLASICLHYNKIVTGSDIQLNENTKFLEGNGIHIFNKHIAGNVHNADIVVYTGAIKLDNIELVEANKLNIPIIERSRFLALISQNYKNVIAISGTHGKTTTCGMLANIFIVAGKEPTVHIGGQLCEIGGNVHIGKTDYFITEACEYRRSLLELNPTVAVVLNEEEDHLDCYKDLSEIKQAFNLFKMQSDYAIVKKGNEICKKNITFSLNGGDFYAKNIVSTHNSQMFDVFYQGKFFEKFMLTILGEYNIENALSAIAVSNFFGINKNDIKKGLLCFKGVSRRYERISNLNGTEIFRDYGHHPTEMNCVIDIIKQQFKNPLIVFQPHTYSRTKFLFNRFIEVLKPIRNLVIYKTYPAREKYIKGGSAKELFNHLNSFNEKTKYLSTEKDLKKYIKNNSQNFDCILFLGAGNIGDICERIIMP